MSKILLFNHKCLNGHSFQVKQNRDIDKKQKYNVKIKQLTNDRYNNLL